jgi:hypothetical protein
MRSAASGNVQGKFDPKGYSNRDTKIKHKPFSIQPALLAGDNIHTLIWNHGDLGGTELEVLLGHLDREAP